MHIQVGADVNEAVKGLRQTREEFNKTGAAAKALPGALNKTSTAFNKIPQTVKPAIQAVSKLGDNLETLQAKLLARKEFIKTEKDVARIATLNAEIKLLQGEILRVQAIGKGGVNLGGIGQAATKGFSALRQAAFVLPGIGIAGILGGATDALVSLFSSADKTNEKLKELLVSVSSIRESAAASTAGDSAKVNALASVVLDQTKAYEQRNRALQQLKEINKSYFGDLTLEAQSLAVLKSRVNEYTQAIVQQAVIKEFADQIAKLTVEQAKNRGEIVKTKIALDSYTASSIKAQQKRPNLAAGPLQGFSPESIKGMVDSQEKLNGLNATQAKVNAQLREFNAAMNEAVITSLQFRPLEITKGDKGTEDIDKVVKEAQKMAALLDKNTQFAVKFEIEPFDDPAVTRQKAKAFLQKTRAFFQENSSEFGTFDLKPLVFVEPQFKIDPKFFRTIREQAGIEATKTHAEVFKEFAELVKNMPRPQIVIDADVRINAGIRKEDLQQKEIAQAVGLRIDTSSLSEIQKQAVVAANAVNNTLTPAFESLFNAIVAGQNPIQAFFQSLMQSLQQLISQLITAAIKALILAAIFPGGVGGAKGFGAIFGKLLGFRAGGGPVRAGHPYVVGERGPELWVPNMSGSIISNAAMNKLSNPTPFRGGGQTLAPIVLSTVLRGRDIKLQQSRQDRQNRRMGA